MSSPIESWLSQSIKEMKDGLAKDPQMDPTLRVLGALNYKLNSRLSLFDKPEERCLAYLLSLLIDDIFVNLTGDFPYAEKAIDEKREFCSQVRQNMEKLATNCNDIKGVGWAAICELVDSYFTALHNLEEILDERRNSL